MRSKFFYTLKFAHFGQKHQAISLVDTQVSKHFVFLLYKQPRKLTRLKPRSERVFGGTLELFSVVYEQHIV